MDDSDEENSDEEEIESDDDEMSFSLFVTGLQVADGEVCGGLNYIKTVVSFLMQWLEKIPHLNVYYWVRLDPYYNENYAHHYSFADSGEPLAPGTDIERDGNVYRANIDDLVFSRLKPARQRIRLLDDNYREHSQGSAIHPLVMQNERIRARTTSTLVTREDLEDGFFANLAPGLNKHVFFAGPLMKCLLSEDMIANRVVVINDFCNMQEFRMKHASFFVSSETLVHGKHTMTHHYEIISGKLTQLAQQMKIIPAVRKSAEPCYPRLATYSVSLKNWGISDGNDPIYTYERFSNQRLSVMWLRWNVVAARPPFINRYMPNGREERGDLDYFGPNHFVIYKGKYLRRYLPEGAPSDLPLCTSAFPMTPPLSLVHGLPPYGTFLEEPSMGVNTDVPCFARFCVPSPFDSKYAWLEAHVFEHTRGVTDISGLPVWIKNAFAANGI
jgi:hypothetical protein